MKYPKATTTCKNSFSFKNKNKIQLKSVMDFVNFRDYQLGELIHIFDVWPENISLSDIELCFIDEKNKILPSTELQ